jgi:hypothetical protein
MRADALRRIVKIPEPDPFGDVTLAPEMMTGRREADLAGAMAAALMQAKPANASEALRHLRLTFPESPLTLRIAALAQAMRR